MTLNTTIDIEGDENRITDIKSTWGSLRKSNTVHNLSGSGCGQLPFGPCELNMARGTTLLSYKKLWCGTTVMIC